MPDALSHFRTKDLKSAERSHHHFDFGDLAVLVEPNQVDTFELAIPSAALFLRSKPNHDP